MPLYKTIKIDSIIFIDQLPKKKPTQVKFSIPSVIIFYCHSAFIKDLFEVEIVFEYKKNKNNNKAININFLFKEYSEDNDL